jgi:hypothetical protein
MLLAIIAILFLTILISSSSWERAKRLNQWKYGFDRKVHYKRLMKGPFKTDCSGFVTYVLGLNHKLGSWEIVKKMNAAPMLTLDERKMRHQSIIAFNSGPHDFDENRENGVDHIAVVLRGWDMQLYLCDCRLNYGVRILPLHEGIIDWNSFALEKKFGTEYMSKFGPLTKTFYVKY